MKMNRVRRNKKAQVTSEYMVLFAVVAVICAFALSFQIGVPGNEGSGPQTENTFLQQIVDKFVDYRNSAVEFMTQDQHRWEDNPGGGHGGGGHSREEEE